MELLTVQECAKFLNISVQLIYQKTSKKQIPHFKKGKKLYFDKLELLQWIKSDKISHIIKYTIFTEKEKKVIEFLCQGQNHIFIAEELSISWQNVYQIKNRIVAKIQNDRTARVKDEI